MKIILTQDHELAGFQKRRGQVFEVTRIKRDELVNLRVARDYPNGIDTIKQIIKKRGSK